ncbi:HvfX family Cu-binding RiPP maturation protein [Ferruginibacter albus]|uniref:HvfX family Cu-binding RiPP maturation protein n=1 Tax=Ferruginibacter albus TaxID=2875540 RepID=UPI001CC6327D|nr:DoxX family protein [Ferruginibacter albus]UAY53154.1 DoxX family protein [Ferruginibacter albus]
MQKLAKFYITILNAISSLKDLPPLFMRWVLAYGFYQTAKMKWSDINSVADWFASIGIAAPKFNAYLAAGTESVGVALLILGLATRFISIPLIITMIVAIKTVHWANGFDAGDNGFEIPLYYLIMLFALLANGPGRISIDYFIKKKAEE